MDFIKRFQEWIGLKEKLDRGNKPPFFNEGEIWWTAVGENVGVEVNGKDINFSRPVLVFKKFNSHGFVGIPLSTKSQKGSWYVSFISGRQIITANLSQLRFFSSFRLYSKQGMLDGKHFDKVKQAFERLFYRNFPFNEEGNVGNPKNIISLTNASIESIGYNFTMQEIKLGKWKHFKGHTVEVVGVAKNSENYDEEFVVYHHPDEDGKDQMWIRPVPMFLETIERDGKTMKRFEYLRDN